MVDFDEDRYDIDKDGTLDQDELHDAEHRLALAIKEEKANTKRRMAWIAMLSMLVFTVVVFSPIISDERLLALGEVLPMFYIAQAGVIGAYFGVDAWMNKSS